MKYLSILLSIIFFSNLTTAQEQYTLQRIIQIAQSQSPNALQAVNRKENRFWQYRNFISNYRPQLNLSGTLPDFTRSINAITQPDGSDAFRERSQLSLSTQLSLSQAITATGGRIFLSSRISRLDVLSGTNTGITYLSNPIQIGIEQPLFAFNNLRWDKRIEPLRYQESIKRYSEDFEQIALNATDLFFNLLVSQITFEIALKNQANNDTIFKIAEGRYSLGRIAENELLQLQLNVMNSSQQVSQARLDIESNQLKLKAFLGNTTDLDKISLVEPKDIPVFLVDAETAINQAKNNREKFIAFKRQRLEVEREVARAKGDNGLNVNVFGSLGFTQNADNIPDAYQQLENQQTVNVGFQIPLLDWGRQKSQIRTALANEKLVKSTIEQDELTFEQEIYLKIKQFEILKERLKIAQQSDQIAQKRYDISQNRYLIAKISITDLNIALQEKDGAKRDYLEALRSFWRAVYEIRQLTLYDFEKGQVIEYK